MNRLNPEKLLRSKWTSRKSENKEKHFIVTLLLRDDENKVIACDIEAVLSRQNFRIDWQQLKNSDQWQFGWK